ncbi:hypothetical protein [Bartonella koehlerae]|uniref:Uncharacterized protein n=1 Tax=Bartonella koehlerae C-29 TaxID=1134510 RepID=A0A067WIL2_9HYPH|nr:hypothetical protein [Bartonella koehlerae]KEC55762.1 hypothetical protein O9A_00540 [Bartonella koehlerae C-29]
MVTWHHERVWIDSPLYKGLRRSDAVCIGWQDTKDNIIHLKTEKSKFKTDVLLILPELAEIFKISSIGKKTFIFGKKGKKITEASFGVLFCKACIQADTKKSAHGLKKLAATRTANSGANSIKTQSTFEMGGRYYAILLKEHRS